MQGRSPHLILPLASLLLAACDGDSRRAPALMEVFAGPISLELREEVTPGTRIVASVKHGEKLDVIGTRRRFVQVRTAAGQQGWTDARLLLTVEDMAELDRLSRRAAALPSHGEATVYDPLNMHAEPNRGSMSFYQITEGRKVDVVAHIQAARQSASGRLTLALPKRETAPRKPRRRKGRAVELPRSYAPRVPDNWQALSRSVLPAPTPEEIRLKLEEERRRKAAEPPVRMEDWNLVRTKDGKAGWVLAGSLVSAIPDEVAQYSEGRRITSYFSLGSVVDAGATKQHWLWTTISSGSHPYEFDSFRVFMWVVKKHRYETIYIEPRVKGYYPVRAQPGRDFRFTLILEDEDGLLWEKTYEFQIYLVRLIDSRPYRRPAEPPLVSGSPGSQGVPIAAAESEPEMSMSDRFRTWTQRLFRN